MIKTRNKHLTSLAGAFIFFPGPAKLQLLTEKVKEIIDRISGWKPKMSVEKVCQVMLNIFQGL